MGRKETPFFHRDTVWCTMNLSWLSEGWQSILKNISNMSLPDVIDIVCVSVLFYYLYVFVRDRRAGKLAMGVILIFSVQLIASVFDMYVMQFLLQNIFQTGLLMLIVLFQPELRSMLEKMGGQSLRGIRGIGDTKAKTETLHMLEEVTDAVQDMSASKTGALIVFERGTRLGEVSSTGTVINADPESFLIKNIFFNKAPLHDGAMIIRQNRIHAAGCLLPLSQNPDIIKDLGTRHRAGIGMSENSDAVVVIVSEETGTISVASEGSLTRDFNKTTLLEALRRYLLPESESTVSMAKRTLNKWIPGQVLGEKNNDKNSDKDNKEEKED